MYAIRSYYERRAPFERRLLRAGLRGATHQLAETGTAACELGARLRGQIELLEHGVDRHAHGARHRPLRITSYNVCYTKLLRSA